MLELVVFGTLLTVGEAGLLFLQPLNWHIPAVLLLLSALTAVLGFLFIRLRRLPDNADAAAANGAAFVILLFAALMRFAAFPAAPTLSDDVYRYLWDGRVQLAGLSPYRYPPSDEHLAGLRDANHAFINHPTVRTIYPPISEWVFRAAAFVSPTPASEKFAFILFDLCSVAALLWLLKLRRRPLAWAVLYAWNPFVAVEFGSSGHNDSLMLFFLILGLAFEEAGQPLRSAVSFALAALSKWIPFILVPWLLIRRRWKQLAVYAGVLVVLCLPFAIDTWHRVESLEATTGVRTFTKDWVFNAGLYDWLAPLIPDTTRRKAFLGALLAIFAFWFARISRRDGARYMYVALVGLLVASPIAHPWYLTWLVPFAAILGTGLPILWEWAASLSYVVLIRYATEGVWFLPAWVTRLEYSLVYAAIIVGLYWRVRRPRPAVRRPEAISTPRVSVIIPALNEEKAIGLVIADIPKENLVEVIVVDNGSTDGTAAAAALSGARVIAEPRRGYGTAVQTGIAAMSPQTNIVVVLDGDRSDFPEELPKLIQPIREGRADLVIGSRSEAALPGSLMPQQRFGNWLTCALIRLLYGVRFTDMGPFRAIRRTALEEMGMVDPNFGWNVEMQVKAIQRGLATLEVPVRYRPRIGVSKISGSIKGSFRAGTIILWAIYHYVFVKPAPPFTPAPPSGDSWHPEWTSAGTAR